MLGNRLKQLRISHHLNQADVAEYLQVSRSTYSLYETDKRQMPYAALIRLAEYYSVSLDYLFDRTDEPKLPKSLSETEKWALKRFRSIDNRGRNAIMVISQYEYLSAIKRKDAASKQRLQNGKPEESTGNSKGNISSAH